MKNALRWRYFRFLSLLIVSYYIAFALMLWAFNLHEISEVGHDPGEERQELYTLLALGACLIPPMLLLAWDISRRMLKPLWTIALEARRISRGEMNVRVADPGLHDEVSALAGAVNAALDKHHEVTQKFDQFAGNASHQLRTPLTAIRSTGEIALQSDRTTAEYREVISDMLESAGHLSRLVEQLLQLARLDKDRAQATYAPVNLCALASEMCSQFQPLATERGIRIICDAAPGPFISGNADLLRQALINLLDNAIRHTPPDGTIQVSVRNEKNGRIGLRVADTGPGIPPERRTRLFERFAPRDESSKGAGLGLSIVSEIILLHGGSITLMESARPGACFEILLPTDERDG